MPLRLLTPSPPGMFSTKFGPAKYWPDTLACIHPETKGGDASGALVIMREFYKQYWSKALSC